jgi:DNA-binding GntR family transcriptional regulator
VRSVERIATRLRAAIMSGELEPGAVLSQVKLAQSYGVSRTPLREAIRRLEAEGLIDARQNQRARVAPVDAEELDVLFTERILVEAMGVKVTVPQLTEVDLNGLLSTTAKLRIASAGGDADARDRARRELHVQYVARAGERLRASIAAQFDACESYRRRYAPMVEDVVEAYARIGGLCIARDGAGASSAIGRLEARLAAATLAALNPAYDPVAIRTALAMLEGPPA